MHRAIFSIGLPAWIPTLLLAALLQSASLPQLYSLGSVVDGDTLDGQTVDGLNFIWASVVSPDGKHVYTCGGVANISGDDDNAIAAFARQETGLLSFVQVIFDNDETPSGQGDGLRSCRDVVVSPDGKFVYTAGASDDKIGIFQRDPDSGKLTFSGAAADGVAADGLRGVTALSISPDGTALFAVGRADDTLTAFTRNPSTGSLTFASAASNELEATGLDRPLEVAVSPDGQHIYTVAGSSRNFAGSDAIALFTWNAQTNKLAFVEAYVEGTEQNGKTIRGLHQVSSVRVSPDGKFVYASSALWVTEPQNLN